MKNLVRDLETLKFAPQVLEKIPGGAFLTVRAAGKVNVMTIGWAMIGVVWWRPMLMVMVRNSRHTFKLMEEARGFSVAVPLKGYKKELEICGKESGRHIDKFKLCNFKTVGGRKLSIPVLNIPGVHFECRLVYKTALDPKVLNCEYDYLYPKKDYHTLYFGEIVDCYRK
ncbi:MAG: flavin reductase family protein [Candidatus Omnitrophota bacterium]